MPDAYPFSSTQIAEALATLQQSSSKKIDSGFLMLCVNYEADNMEISTSRLGKAAGYDNYNTANEQYGSFAHVICDELGYTPKLRDNGKPIWTSVLCEESSEKDNQGHFQWKIRPQVAEALEDLGIVQRIARTDLLDEIKAKEDTLTGYSEKDRETIIKARIGQGEFRKRLIRFWGGCSVTAWNSSLPPISNPGVIVSVRRPPIR
jgi:predicted HNH restriction endonuclease